MLKPRNVDFKKPEISNIFAAGRAEWAFSYHISDTRIKKKIYGDNISFSPQTIAIICQGAGCGTEVVLEVVFTQFATAAIKASSTCCLKFWVPATSNPSRVQFLTREDSSSLTRMNSSREITPRATAGGTLDTSTSRRLVKPQSASFTCTSMDAHEIASSSKSN